MKFLTFQAKIEKRLPPVGCEMISIKKKKKKIESPKERHAADVVRERERGVGKGRREKKRKK